MACTTYFACKTVPAPVQRPARQIAAEPVPDAERFLQRLFRMLRNLFG